MRFLAPLAFSMALMLSACTTAQPVTESGAAAPKSPILGQLWVAEDIAGAGVVSGADVTLFMDANARAGGKAGCNTYGSGLVEDGNNLKFTQDFSTRMACSPDAVMVQEQTYLGLLGAVTSYELQDDKLVLTTTDGKTITYHKK